MPPQSRGHRLDVRPNIGAHSKSSPNLSKKPEPIPPIPETSTKPSPPKLTTQSQRRVPKEPSSNDVQSKTTPAFLPGAPTEKISSSEELSIEERDFAAIHRGSTSSTSASEDSDQEQDPDRLTSDSSGLLPPLPSLQPRPARPFYNFSSRSHSSLGLPQHEHSRPHSVHALAPPFYNRPPTPLPPSPSLTSLLRPLSFSALPSRQTTPDSSDTEGPSIINGATGTAATRSSTAAVVGHAARTATTVPRASPKVPTYEYYGFVLHLGSSLAFLMYILWSYLPTPFLHQLGIYYYPNRWWSLAIPAWLVMVICYIFVALAAYNTGYMTLKMGDLGCLVDEKGQIAVVDEKGRIVRGKRMVEGESGGGGGGDAANATKKEGGIDVKVHKENRNAQVEVEGLGHASKLQEEELPELDWKTLWNDGTDAVMDVPLGGVCEILYGEDRDTDSDDGDDYYD